MIVRKSLKIPVHYDTTNTKIGILNRLTARITYCIMLISGRITEGTEINRPTLRKLVKENEIAWVTGLSAGFIDQCIDKVIWAWRSYNKAHKKWDSKVKRAEEKSKSARDEKEITKREKSLENLLEKEPSKPSFD